MITIFECIDVTNGMPPRSFFCNKAHTLFVMPDNNLDYTLPRDQLHNPRFPQINGNDMRPKVIGMGDLPIPQYDIQRMGLPTTSHQSPLTEHDMEVAFLEIFRLIQHEQYTTVAVLYKNGRPWYPCTNNNASVPWLENIVISKMDVLQQIINTKAHFNWGKQKTVPVLQQFDLSKFYLLLAKSALLVSFSGIVNKLVTGVSVLNSPAIVGVAYALAFWRNVTWEVKAGAYHEYKNKKVEDIQSLSANQLTAFLQGVKSANNFREQVNSTLPIKVQCLQPYRLQVILPAADRHWIAYYAGLQAREKGDVALIEHIKAIKNR